jgi:anti-anti-sigma factor
MSPGEINCLLANDASVIRVTGDFDQTLVDLFTDAVTGGDGDVVVELGEVTFVDSSALHCLVAAKHSLAERCRSMVIASRSEPVARVLELTGLDEEFESVG